MLKTIFDDHFNEESDEHYLRISELHSKNVPMEFITVQDGRVNRVTLSMNDLVELNKSITRYIKAYSAF